MGGLWGWFARMVSVYPSGDYSASPISIIYTTSHHHHQTQSKRGSRFSRKKDVGNGLLSHTVTSAVPSALVGLTSGFGMGPGVPPQL